jgi:hypothetical protein
MSLTKATYSMIEGAPANVLDFGAVGDGVADDAVALQAWLDSGGELYCPSGFTFKSNAKLQINVSGTRISGFGTVTAGQRFAGGLFEVNADDVQIENITISNPGLYSSTTGPQFCGVLVKADRCWLSQLKVLDFEMGLNCDAYGEHYDTWYINNRIRVLGVGPGTPDSGSGAGEDRGDGITHWGGRATIHGNHILARDNTDARDGIFFEGLNSLPIDPSGRDNSAACSIVGNLIGLAEGIANGGGRFRRGIDVEEGRRVVVNANVVRSCAWMDIQVAGNSDEATISNNIIFNDLPASNANGASWGPIRSMINIYGNGLTQTGLTVTGNTLLATQPSKNGININGIGTSTLINGLISGNNIIATVDMGTSYFGIFAQLYTGASEIVIQDNSIKGDWHAGVYADGIPDISIKGNTIRNVDDFAVDVRNCAAVRIGGNHFRNTAYGIQSVTCTAVFSDGNVWDGVGGLHVANAGTTTFRAINNTVIGGGGTVNDFGTLTVPLWKNNAGFAYLTGTSTYDPASVSSGTAGGNSGNITVTGAQAGDYVTASWSDVTQGLAPMASVSAANTVIAGFINPTGGAINLGSGTMTVSVERG